VLTAFEKILGSRLMTIRPLDAPAGRAEPYDYGFPTPAGADTGADHGTVD
jgi:hypothetical protein